MNEENGKDVVPDSNLTDSTENERDLNRDDLKDNEMPKYIYAYDPKIKKRVPHVVVGGYAISMVSGNRFKYKPSTKKK